MKCNQFPVQSCNSTVQELERINQSYIKQEIYNVTCLSNWNAVVFCQIRYNFFEGGNFDG